ncbi:hypothetical protein [Nocardia sp. NPDC060249]|uniref:hypothetical protein n=1 Tax=Nocardia sp. NPDC060249 TaxID=3347082 RepID=UPI003652600D
MDSDVQEPLSQTVEVSMPRTPTECELAYERSNLHPDRIRAYARKVVAACLRADIETRLFDGHLCWVLSREVIWSCPDYQEVNFLLLTTSCEIVFYPNTGFFPRQPDRAPYIGDLEIYQGKVLGDDRLDVLDRKAVLGSPKREYRDGPKVRTATYPISVATKGEGLSRALNALLRKVPEHLRADPTPTAAAKTPAVKTSVVPQEDQPREATGRPIEYLLTNPPRPEGATRKRPLNRGRANQKRRR